ncbi:Heat shock factor protein 4 [Tieghemiomyces parasiticus]|uniref:Heat shock factor protein 4 n=1 Tax=Tieghemiomyces parasiticus TaxID=78921 RepID=A0A9W8A0I5_9FUNG|nr:Heat shock factor protein 4 [Tieghemiomyces parasiticus]
MSDPTLSPKGQALASRKSKTLFPEKLYCILESEEHMDCIWWNDKGTGFCVDRSRINHSTFLANHFKTDKKESFERQLRGYDFKLLIDNRKSKDRGKLNAGYSHPCFIRGSPHLLSQVKNLGNYRKTKMRQEAKKAKSQLLVQTAPTIFSSSPDMNRKCDRP